jgi:hypothetical protein
MATNGDLAHLAAQVGLTSQQMASALAVAALVGLFAFRRPLVRFVMFVFRWLFKLAAVVMTLGGAVWVYERFGVLYAAGFILVGGLFFAIVGRIVSAFVFGPPMPQADLDREHQLREAERIRRVHEDTRRRNPW